MLIIGKSILLIINNTRSIQNPKLLFFILIIHHVLKRTCFLINSQERRQKMQPNIYNLIEHQQTYDQHQQISHLNIQSFSNKKHALTALARRYSFLTHLANQHNTHIVKENFKHHAEYADLITEKENYHLEIQESTLK